MISLLDTVILGLVQGISEFLPISSTGHLILTSKILGLDAGPLLGSFIVAIQVGSIMAVLLLYGRNLRSWELDKKILAAFIPTAVIGFALYKLIKGFLLTSDMVTAWALLLGGLVIMAFERWWGRQSHLTGQSLPEISYRQAFLIGLFQAVAVIPGVSRSAATILGGLAVGLSRAAILEFSFLLAIPTMLAATGYDLMKTASDFSLAQIGTLLLGTLFSFLVSVASIRWLLNYIRRHDFSAFGAYRIILGVAWLLIVWLL